jgi:type III secretion protein U
VSEQESSQAKTEPPTQKRLRDLRRKGQVAKSPDVSATVAIIVGVCFFVFAGNFIMDRIERVLDTAASADFRALMDPQALSQWTAQMLLEVVWITLPIIVVLVVVAAVTSFIQVGPVFASEQVTPKLERIDPIAGIKRLFSIRTFVELCKLFVKAALLTAVIWLTARHALPALLQSHWLRVEGLLPLALRLLKTLCWFAIAAFIAVAAFDLWFQKWEFLRRNRMSIEEVRREHKEVEGDPLMRHRRKQLHREAVEVSMLGNVRRANVVVVNPTHIAVALFYEAGETDLPLVVAKGEGELARAIRKIAEEEGIPIMHDVDLARRLRSDAPVDQYIPEELIEPVAAVLRWARDLQRPQ